MTIAATDANGVTEEKTFEVHVLDAPEATDDGLAARGTITIDANTALAGENGGVNWDAYLEDYFAKIHTSVPTFLPSGTGWETDNPSSEFLFMNTSDGTAISIKGSDLVYNWTDPISGEVAHVISGTIAEMSFGTAGVVDAEFAITDSEVVISGLDLYNDSDLMNRIYGETQIVAQTWMYGTDGASPGDIEFLKAVLASYAQNFIGSSGADVYSGTLFADTIAGNAGIDTLAGGGGDDEIDGGDGHDLAVYTGNEADYTVTENHDGSWTVTDNRTGAINDGTDSLTSIEAVQFADGTAELIPNTAPTDLLLSKNSVTENVTNGTNGTVIGVLSATDAEGDTLIWSVSGGNSKFAVATENGVASLVVDGALDYENKSSHSVTLTASDGDLETSQSFKIKVKDVVDQVTGTAKNNTLRGGDGADVIECLGGDKLYGKRGADELIGGKGADQLHGGAGADTFVFAKGDSGKTQAKADTIFDFAKADSIDLTGWDANAKTGGNQDFDFISEHAFTGRAGELRFTKEKSDTWIEGDTNGDGKADFMIHLDDAFKLKIDHFDL